MMILKPGKKQIGVFILQKSCTQHFRFTWFVKECVDMLLLLLCLSFQLLIGQGHTCGCLIHVIVWLSGIVLDYDPKIVDLTVGTATGPCRITSLAKMLT